MRIGPYYEVLIEEVVRNTGHPVMMAMLIFSATGVVGTPWLFVSLMGVEVMLLSWRDWDRGAGWFRFVIWPTVGMLMFGGGAIATGVQDGLSPVTFGWLVAILGVVVASSPLHSTLMNRGFRRLARDLLVIAAGGTAILIGSHLVRLGPDIVVRAG